MSNFMDKIKYFIGVQDLEDEEVNEDYEEYEEDYDVAVPTKTKKLNNKVVNIHTNSNMKIIVHEPLSYDEAPSIIDDLKSRKTVIVNLEQLDNNIKRQIFDFISGGLYALEGNIQKVTKDIFIFAPSNVEIDGLKDELKSKGIFSW
ncbi:cell division protein SepF [Tissierella sp. P1]|jgi:cell division inhibitor SepF|uniref:cell division protein SepF n=1 Tax=unclassified Tissierella TaxID=2638726 RepID=UPI000BA11C79|nr:cell division protein SepF [Tissierella sp. P1]MDU5083155.1 cell division protein SepF [Bacillota bacterium]OZV12839.1 cell division protein SepF [Tissierella sp. P1]